MTVVVGYVPTPELEAALRGAGDEAKPRSEPRVVVSSRRGESNVSPTQPATSTRSRRVAELKSAGVAVEVFHRELTGDPVEAILAAVDEGGASLVVVGLKRRSAVGKLVLGSTAQTVMLRARCFVLGVKV
jgi:nucleotide-binding universal stress UspA family protein